MPRGWMNKACALVHAYKTGHIKYRKKALTRLAERHSLRKPMEMLSKQVEQHVERAYDKWIYNRSVMTVHLRETFKNEKRIGDQ